MRCRPYEKLMRPCPYCGVVIESVHGTGTVTIEEDGKTTKKAMEKYSCPACGGKFAVVKTRRESMLIPARDVEGMQARLARATAGNESLRKKMNELVRETRSLRASLKTARENAYYRSLQGRVTELEQHVEFLRKEKGRLEEQVARMG
jgi:ssDNA-binding Zn-finger/Zn-ribbon topoisomerase 1